MGKVKQLLPLGGTPVVRRSLDSIIGSGINDIVVVLSPLASLIIGSISRLPATVVFNNEPSSEMADSVRIGLRNVDASSSGVLIHLADYPLVSVETLRSLIAAHETIPHKILIPVYKNERGHPCLFPTKCANEIFRGFTLREIVHRDKRRIRLVNVDDDGILLDMDTEKDYHMMIRHMQLKKLQ